MSVLLYCYSHFQNKLRMGKHAQVDNTYERIVNQRNWIIYQYPGTNIHLA